jgi:predicted amidohydrolase
MKIAAYQAPVLPSGSMAAIELIRQRVVWCEAEGVEILCCPEGVLGGLADYAARPTDFALDVATGQLNATLAPLASQHVTTILGFTEIDAAGGLFNSAAVFHRGAVLGVYRKLHPAIRRSVYQAGHEHPVFSVGALTFGIVICNDSNFSEPAHRMAAKGATALFVPTNNGLPHARASPELIARSREADRAREVENRQWVIRADVAGVTDELMSHGSSGITSPDGTVVRCARPMSVDLVVAEIDVPL